MKELGRIMRLRGLSQRKLAEEAGVTESTVWGILAGAHSPRPSTVRKISQALDVDIADLYGEEPLPKGPAPQEEQESGQLRTETPVTDLVRAGVRRELEEERRAANRAYAAEKPQAEFSRYQNEADAVLLERDRDELTGELLDAVWELERERQRLESEVARLREMLEEESEASERVR